MGDRATCWLHVSGTVDESDLGPLIEAIASDRIFSRPEREERAQILKELRAGEVEFDEVNYAQMDAIDGLEKALEDLGISFVWEWGEGGDFGGGFCGYDTAKEQFHENIECHRDLGPVVSIDELDNAKLIGAIKEACAFRRRVIAGSLTIVPAPPPAPTPAQSVWAHAMGIPSLTTNGEIR